MPKCSYWIRGFNLRIILSWKLYIIYTQHKTLAYMFTSIWTRHLSSCLRIFFLCKPLVTNINKNYCINFRFNLNLRDFAFKKIQRNDLTALTLLTGGSLPSLKMVLLGPKKTKKWPELNGEFAVWVDMYPPYRKKRGEISPPDGTHLTRIPNKKPLKFMKGFYALNDGKIPLITRINSQT